MSVGASAVCTKWRPSGSIETSHLRGKKKAPAPFPWENDMPKRNVHLFLGKKKHLQKYHFISKHMNIKKPYNDSFRLSWVSSSLFLGGWEFFPSHSLSWCVRHPSLRMLALQILGRLVLSA